MVAKLSLGCWILGDRNPFMVAILPSKTVDYLKDTIKKKKQPALDHIAADELNIWKVNSPSQRTRHY